MSKPHFDVPLTIEPEHELRFVGPFNRAVVTIMTLRNNSAMPLVFKIKTTAPKRYCVRPNIGKIAPFRSTQVEICLQPFMYDQQEKNKHKFMVQSVLAPNDADLTDLNKLWKELEPEQLMDAKLKCVFEMPSSEANAENNSSGNVAGGGSGISAGAGVNTSSTSGEANKVGDGISKLASNEDKTSIMSDAIESMTGEIKTLRECNSELRTENLKLKDQVTRFRSSTVKPVNEPYAPVLAEKQIPIFYIAIAIAAAFFGSVIGQIFSLNAINPTIATIPTSENNSTPTTIAIKAATTTNAAAKQSAEVKSAVI